MPIVKGLEWTFNTRAELYDRMRPGYPKELYQDLFAYKPVDAALEEGAYDLVYSASAFHWIPEEIGYPKVYGMLKPGGAFARFANHPNRDPNHP